MPPRIRARAPRVGTARPVRSVTCPEQSSVLSPVKIVGGSDGNDSGHLQEMSPGYAGQHGGARRPQRCLSEKGFHDAPVAP